MNDPKKEKIRESLSIFTESILKPDDALRRDAYNADCFDELMEWRQEVLDYLSKRRFEEFLD